MQRHCSDAVDTDYKLLPYLGGDEPAPHDIRIKIKECDDHRSFSGFAAIKLSQLLRFLETEIRVGPFDFGIGILPW